MAYTKNTWVDQDVERPKTYEVTNNQDGSITLTDSFGLVTELGTPVNATNMNHIEEGIDGCAIRKHNLTETFALGEWVLGGSGDDEGIYKSLIANNVGNAISDDTKWEKVELGGSGGRNVGEIISSTLPLTDAGLHLLDGTRLSGDGIYKEFLNYIANLYAENPSANYFTTEALWQQSVSQYGVCGKFVYDSVNNTVRLPKVTGIIEGTTDVSALSDLVEESLPNIKGNIVNTAIPNYGVTPSANGAISISTYGNNSGFNTSSGAWIRSINLDASRSSSTYQDNARVQPQTIKVFYYIVIATSTKTDIQVDLDKIATDLNGKADTDLANVTDSAKVMMSGMGMPCDTYIDLTLGASGSSYTAPANGWFQAACTGDIGSTYFELSNKYRVSSTASYTGGWARTSIPVRKGDVIDVYYGGNNFTKQMFRFTYAVGSESEAQ